ncbi:RagB/SusD family nutrient uptake outer membrane protein [Pedobacter nyackensis]|uniref:RagB/SusD family nutrient uptake outer membrane protein n=1 Tax=Pedobacter nyackensis TaxID=475255 RepID=UPI00293038E2|nr:RagB/SusD family nutrient uptake outer membrane protein [Pedobacter nyackensis]
MKKINQISKKALIHKMRIYLYFLFIASLFTSCKKSFLDVAPDNLARIENAFTLRAEAEKYLFTCYSYIPDDGNTVSNPAFLGGDEMCTPIVSRSNSFAANIPRGNQNVVNPYYNYWDGTNESQSMFRGIRDCNVFIQNMKDMTKVPDISLDERNRWIAEGQFLKAYYHFILMRAYGPIPTVDVSPNIDEPIENMKLSRMPVDSVTNFIVKYLDMAAVNLPDNIQNTANELGRLTRPAALAMKARVLVLAASPLFNGNPDYTSFKDKKGVQLINTTYDAKKWERAALACKTAITSCENAGLKLFEFPASLFKISDSTKRQMSLRNAVTQKWQNSELIWGNSRSNTNNLQLITVGHFDGRNGRGGNAGAIADVGATMKMADQFYTANGVPISEDKILTFGDKTERRVGVQAERFNNILGYTSSRYNFDREGRFYASLSFDGGVWYQESSPSRTDENTYNIQSRLGGTSSGTPLPITGYFCKKLVNWKFSWGDNNSIGIERYPWPTFRLADLYLLYAEALNEFSGPGDDVYEYLNRIRIRSGLKTVQEAWTTYSNNPGKYQSKDGLRSIIRQERTIELAMEGSRFWDLRRWKTASLELNGNVQGWDIQQSNPILYYRQLTFFSQRFVGPRDYLWPITENTLLVNENLVQNPGW